MTESVDTTRRRVSSGWHSQGVLEALHDVHSRLQGRWAASEASAHQPLRHRQQRHIAVRLHGHIFTTVRLPCHMTVIAAEAV